MTGSEHFAAEHWVDFVRHAASDEQARMMETHLSEGCRSCRQAHTDWQRVWDAAAKDAAYDVPEGVVRVARAMFSIQKAPTPLTRAVEAVKVLFDSQLTPAVAGVRSAWGNHGRKILYHMGDFLVDVQIEEPRAGRRTVVIGQVVCGNGTILSVDRVPVILLRDLSVIGKCVTSQSGEFHMEFDGPSGNLSVALGLREEGTALSLDPSVRHS